jgi:hypothetical protein
MLALTMRLRDVKKVEGSVVLGRAATDGLITKHVAKNLMERVMIEGKYDGNGLGDSKGRSVSVYITPKIRQ